MASPKVVVKGGKRYHYYPNRPAGKRYVLVQPRAAMKTGKGHAAGSSARPKASPAPAATPTAAPAPAPSVPLINPFLRPEDLQSIADFQFEMSNSLADIDKGLADLGTQTTYDRQQVDRSAKQGSSDATDNAIARGLFRSSVKDATLYDIEGQRVRQQQLYTDRMNNATLDAERRKAILRSAQEALQTRMAQQAVSNAREVSANQPVAVPGAPQAAAAQPKFKSVAGRDSKGNPGVWHIYPDGRKVFVRK